MSGGRRWSPVLPGRVPSSTPVPKVNSPSQAPSAKAGQQVYIATIVSVDSTTNPTVAVVAPNNALPLVSGCAIPSSLGVTFQEAPHPFVAPPMNVAYFNNTTYDYGGAFCYVDLTSRQILGLAQGDSLTAPINDAALFQFIEHNGAYNSNGNFQNPAPIDNTQLLGDPYLTHAPSINSVGSFTYFGSGSGAFDAEISFDILFNTPPWNSTTNIPLWLCEVGFLAVPNGSAASTLNFPFGKVLKGVQAPTSSATYTAIFDGLSAANTYDLYCYFIDMKGNCSTAGYIATTVLNPLVVGNANQEGYPGTLSSVTPVATFVSNNGVSLNNGVTFDVSIDFSTDSNGYVGPTNQWLAEVQLWAQVHGTTGKAFQAGIVPPLVSGNYDGVWPSLGNGTTYDLMIRYVDYKGNFSALSNVITNVSAAGVGKAALTTNPNPTVAPAYVTGHTPTNNGGSVTDTHFTYTTNGGGSYDAATNFELDANFTISTAEWLQQVNVYAVANGTTTSPITPSSTANIVNLPALNPGNGSYNVSFNGLSAGISYSIYIAYLDLAGNVTPATLVGKTTTQYINGGNLTNVAPNLVPDSSFVASNFNGSGVGSNNPYWSFEYIDGISYQIAKADSLEPNSNMGWPTNLLRIVSGDSGKYCQALSEAIPVVPGTTYYMSAFFGGGNSSGSMPYAAIVATNWNLGTHSGTPYITLTATSPVAQQTVTNFASPWVCPSGVTQVCFLFNQNDNTIGGGDSLYMGAPYFSMSQGPYVAGPPVKGVTASSAPITDSSSTGGGAVNSAGDVSGTNAHLTMSAGVQGLITASSELLSSPFPGVVVTSDGTMSGFSGSDLASIAQFILPAGKAVSLNLRFQLNASTSSFWCGVAYATGTFGNNCYLVEWTSGTVRVLKYFGGSLTVLQTLGSATGDTSWHSISLIVASGAVDNLIEASFDNLNGAVISDPTLALGAGPLCIDIGATATTKVQDLVVGTGAPLYSSMHPAVTNNINDAGNLAKSTMFNALVPNMTAWTTNLLLHYVSSGTSPSITVKFYYDDGTASTAATVYNPDGSSVNVGFSTAASPSATQTGCSSGDTVYFLMYYSQSSSSMVLTVQKNTPFTITQINAAYADGGYVAFNATTQATSSISAGGSNSIHGGGGNRY